MTMVVGEVTPLVLGMVSAEVEVVLVLRLLGQVLAQVPVPGQEVLVLLVLLLAGPPPPGSPPPHGGAHHPRSQLPAGVCHVLPAHPAGSSAQASIGTLCHPLQ
jgi:hypothetical protein